VLVPPAVWCPPAGPPRCCVPPVVGACPVCYPPLWWVLAPCAGAPPRCCGPDRDHCYDCREATALDAFVRSLHGDTRGAATHTPTGRVSGGLGRRARRHPQRAAGAGIQSAEQWCSSQQPIAAAATAPLPTGTGGELGWPNYEPNRRSAVGTARLRALPFFLVAVRVSPCRCEPLLRAGCCGGEGVFGVL